jgi:hypothetical protein
MLHCFVNKPHCPGKPWTTSRFLEVRIAERNNDHREQLQKSQRQRAPLLESNSISQHDSRLCQSGSTNSAAVSSRELAYSSLGNGLLKKNGDDG